MTLQEQRGLPRKNAYLKQRCARLQDDIVGLSAELQRAREQLEHATARRRLAAGPNPLAGGQ